LERISCVLKIVSYKGQTGSKQIKESHKNSHPESSEELQLPSQKGKTQSEFTNVCLSKKSAKDTRRPKMN
jgi:hypothetical protein